MAPVPPEITHDVQNIHTALTYAVPDQEALVNIIGRREYQQLVTIAHHYKAVYGVDLAAELDKRIIGSVGSLLSGACMHRVLAEVHHLHRSGKSSRKYEALRKKDTPLGVFCEILIGRTSDDLRELHEAFMTLHGVSLLEHVNAHFKDEVIKTFFTAIVQHKEETPLEDVEDTIEKLRSLLYAHDMNGLLVYVSSLTTEQLRMLVRSYNKKHMDAHVVTTIHKVVAPKSKSEHVDILLFAVMQAADPPRHVSLLMEQSMAGLGTNEDQLSRLVVLNRGKFMDKVKTAYQIDYSRTLADRIRGDTSGLYSNLICHLINQTI
ncbi:hypothetical protein BG011_010204 [Mortierella polycephala]|uniref:Annexin n=1 Tax=Mortierella polycephala TaxID=41804 RepID=A0A9P6U7G6_9FUNG|nr:hypothetical protein BG011_010204 [Mortierella polycephala]